MSNAFTFSVHWAFRCCFMSASISKLDCRCATASWFACSANSARSVSNWRCNACIFSRSNSMWVKNWTSCSCSSRLIRSCVSFNCRWIRSRVSSICWLTCFRASSNCRLTCSRSSFNRTSCSCSSLLICSRSSFIFCIAASNARLFSLIFSLHFASRCRLMSVSASRWDARWATASLRACSVKWSRSFSNWSCNAFIFSRSESVTALTCFIIAAWLAACFSDSCLMANRNRLHSASNTAFFAVSSLWMRAILCISKFLARSSFAFIVVSLLWIQIKNHGIFIYSNAFIFLY